MMLEKPTSGTVLYKGTDMSTFTDEETFTYRQDVQMVFQDTLGSLNPRMTISDILTEPYTLHRDILPKKQWSDRVRELLALVGLDPNHANRYPHQFSGGQRQRICIARALALDPKVLVCDEPVSALDVSVQAQIINLLKDLRDRLGLSYIFVAHDLSVVRQIADRVAVMYLGEVVEVGRRGRRAAAPLAPVHAGAGLGAAHRRRDRRRSTGNRIVLSGDLPSPANPPEGCRFRTRCWMAQPKCESREAGADRPRHGPARRVPLRHADRPATG